VKLDIWWDSLFVQMRPLFANNLKIENPLTKRIKLHRSLGRLFIRQ